MSDDKPEGGNSFDQQFREMLKQANLAFRSAASTAQPDAGHREDPPEPKPDRLAAIRDFRLKPREIFDHLNRYVIQQDEAKKVLSVAICDHYNHVRACIEDAGAREREYAKHNIMLLGPTGVGKTYMMRCVAKLIGVPFVKADATKFSETGYVGHDVEDLVRDLVKAADGDVELAQYGIIYLDEIDKIAAQPMVGRDVSGRGVQVNLLKLMEETDVSLFSQTDLLGQMQAIMELQKGKGGGPRTINTRHILFIVSGAFEKLGEQVRRRVSASAIGFASANLAGRGDSDCLRLAETRDFMDYGFEPEFVGRLPVRVTFDPLTAADLEMILRSAEGNVLEQYREDFRGYGIDLQIVPEAIRLIAERAAAEQTGARGLMTVLERVCRQYKFELPSAGVDSFEIGAKTVAQPEEAMAEVMKACEAARRRRLQDEVSAYAAQFEKEHGLALSFDRAAADFVVEACLSGNVSVVAFCRERFRDLEYGLKLIARNTGQASFSITRRFVENPSEELSARIARSFRRTRESPG